jgi:hypothetical protein
MLGRTRAHFFLEQNHQVVAIRVIPVWQLMHIAAGIDKSIFGFLVYCLCFLGCAAAPATITDKSGDADLADLLESIRIKERLPALTAAIIVVTKHGYQLAGTLTLPINFPRPLPAVVLITGSHP